MLFGSSDAANAITVDKTPAALWVMDVSVRLFGLNSWSVLVPQALDGGGRGRVCSTPRCAGSAAPRAALLAGVGLGADARGGADVPVQQPRRTAGAAAGGRRLLRAAGAARRTAAVGGWSAAGAAVGVGFLAKMLQAFLVLPGFARRIWSRAPAAGPPAARLLASLRRRWWCPRAGICCSSNCGRRTPGPTSAAPAQQHRRTRIGLQRVRAG